jgi:von Willebrand factor type A C-terminal domain/von Willebrand factor type A domain
VTAGFTVEVDQNPYLAEGAGRVDAIVTVTASEGSLAGPSIGTGFTAGDGSPPLEMIIVDCSTSMSGERMRAARRATAAAVAELRDGVAFTVIAGTHGAQQVYPPRPGTAVAGPAARAEATAAVERLRASGGTAIGTWLHLARETAEAHAGSLRHAILLTDGQNGEPASALEGAIAACHGVFTCDCRGVGTDWRVEELRAVSSALLGTVDIVADAAHLAADFRAIMSAAMHKVMADVALRLWTPRGAAIRFVKQVAPTVADLTGRRAGVDERRGDYPLGSWGSETRDYHVCVEVPPKPLATEMLAARAALVRAGSDEVLGQGLVKAIWTDDEGLSTGISRGVAHYTGQAELAEAIQEGLAARKAGDVATATARLGRAVALAAASGNDGTARLLARVVDVVDAPSGTVRLRARVDDADEMTLDTRSTKTVRAPGRDAGGA